MNPKMWKSYFRTRERGRRSRDTNHAAFPARQLFVLALCRLCEPIAFMSIFPYAYYMIESFNITRDHDQISMYAGLLITSFTFAEFSTGIVWGKISDKIGRKPALVMGLIGTAVSMMCFGFATNLPTALIARALGGLLNGNVGVLQTTVAELVTVKEHQPRAYSIMPFVWCLGSIVGPAMGGALAQPCKAYPWLFPVGTLFDKFPFLLPNLVCVVVLVFGIAVGVLFLEETHAEKKYNRDYGVELGNYLLSKVFGCEQGNSSWPLKHAEYLNAPSIVDERGPPAYRSRENSPRMTSMRKPYGGLDVERNTSDQILPTQKIFTQHIVLIIAGYGILAYHSVSFDMLMPVLLSQPKSRTAAQLPFAFTGGFALPTNTIGFMMAVQGLYSMIAQLWLFPLIIRRLGTLKTFRMVMLVWPLLYLAVPYTVLLPERLQLPAIYFCLLAKITFHVLAFPSMAILLNNSVPSPLILGTINGVAASTASLSRAFGPAITGSVNAFGLRLGCSGLAWWLNGFVCAIGAIESFWMEEAEGRADRPTEDEDQPTCEPLLHSSSVESTNEQSPLIGHRESLDSVEELDLSIVKA